MIKTLLHFHFDKIVMTTDCTSTIAAVSSATITEKRIKSLLVAGVAVAQAYISNQFIFMVKSKKLVKMINMDCFLSDLIRGQTETHIVNMLNKILSECKLLLFFKR